MNRETYVYETQYFEGSATAVVTPMNGYGNLDFDAFGRLLEWMIREGTDAVVVNGTTGESATLDDKEKWLSSAMP